MTDKEIIIHGINIANCHYYVPCEETGLDCILLNNLSAKCSDDKYKYCYYKQRQRLEQENAELRKDIKACNTCERSAKIYGNENAELKAENERLKEEIDIYRRLLKDTNKSGIEHLENLIKYRQTLSKIKEIAKDNIIGCFCDKCDLADEILQKITKAEEE